MPNETVEPQGTTTSTTTQAEGEPQPVSTLGPHDGAGPTSEQIARADAELDRLLAAEDESNGYPDEGQPQAAPRDGAPRARDEHGRFRPATEEEHPEVGDDGGDASGRQGTGAYEKALETLRREQFQTRELEKLRQVLSEDEVVALARRIGKAQASTSTELQTRAQTIAALEARLAEKGSTALPADDAQEPDDGYAPSYGATQGVVVEKAKALAEKLGLDGDDTVVDALVDLVRSSLPPPPEPDMTGTATASLVESMILAQQRQELGRTMPGLADDDDAWESVLDRTQSLLRTGDYGADYASAFQDAAALTFGDRWYEARRSEGSRRSSQRINGSLEVQSVSNRESEGKPLTLEQRSDRMLMALLARDDGELDEASTQAELARLYRPAY